MKSSDLPDSIVFFDGVCNLCNGLVNFLIKKDVHKKLHYASLQSNFANSFLKDNHPDFSKLDTVYYYDQGQVYHKSSAIGHIFLSLGSGYQLIGRIILFTPPFIADALYSLIARYRYRFWGKSDSCRVPSKEEQSFFIENW